MKITMISNYINHHQIPFSSAMYDRIGDNYCFIQTEPMEEKRIAMGWAVNPADYPYVLLSYEDTYEAKKAVDDCDLLLVGWLENESIIQDRLKAKKLTLRISERLYREGQWKAISPRGLIKKYRDHIRFRKSPVYLLCNGAYVASDYNLIHAYPDKMFKFGYFPVTRHYYDTIELWRSKPKLDTINVEYAEELPECPPVLTENEVQIVWAGRFLELKHPEYMVRLAADLVKLGYRFHIHMIGSGELENELIKQAEYEMVEDYITFYGFMGPEKVRDIMETCHIHIFTSNYLEGWGAVVNEGMNAGLAEVVNDETGAGPYLIEHERNGLLYHNGSYEDMLKQVIKLFENPHLISQYGSQAYDTITTLWNAEIAADRVIDFYEGYIKGDIPVPENGPMSKAQVIKPKVFTFGKLKD